MAGLLGGRCVRRRDWLTHDLLAVVALECEGLHHDQVDHALEALADAHIQLNGYGVQAQLLPHITAHPLRVGADAVHLVDECDPRHAVAFHLLIDGERLALYAAHGAQDHNRPVQHAQRPLDLDGEIDVAGRIDQVDVLALPGDLRGGRRDRDAALPLELHVVHGRSAALVVDLLHAVNPPAIVENALAQGRFARVDMRRDAYISNSVDLFHTAIELSSEPTPSFIRLPVVPAAGQLYYSLIGL